jgi:small redox-active disulfide protein 2
MKIQVLGPGCPKCKKLAENAEAAAKALGVDYELEKVTDIAQILSFGVMMTPALAVAGKVFHRLTQFERWARWATGALFVLIGGYFCLAYIYGVL